MSSYDTEHAIDPSSTSTEQPRRPDLSTFFNNLANVTPSVRTESHIPREGAIPVPAEMSAVFRTLIEAFSEMRNHNDSPDGQVLLDQMINALIPDMESPPTTLRGVDEAYITDLDRVNIKRMPKDAECPICGNAFTDDPHPLLVRLPCHKDHIFDLECIRPWLLTNGTCPLDRADLGARERERKKKREEEIKKAAEADDEEEWDGMYG
ncbi:MAG: hypothetical protein Q9227_005027 [Pyrenula ochraceoflavens]